MSPSGTHPPGTDHACTSPAHTADRVKPRRFPRPSRATRLALPTPRMPRACNTRSNRSSLRLITPKALGVADCVADCRAAIRYLRAHASELGIDPHRIAVGGDSAGGHLAASLATLDDADAASRLDALLLYNSVLDLTEGDWIRFVIGGPGLNDKKNPRHDSPEDIARAPRPPRPATRTACPRARRLSRASFASRALRRRRREGRRQSLRPHPAPRHFPRLHRPALQSPRVRRGLRHPLRRHLSRLPRLAQRRAHPRTLTAPAW